MSGCRAAVSAYADGRGTAIAIDMQMNALNVTDVTRIAIDVAREQSPKLRVVGVTQRARDGNYAEIIIDIAGCHKEPCRFSVGVFRSASASVVRDEIADTLRRHFRQHAAQLARR